MPPNNDKYRLPEGWSSPELVEDVIIADDVTIHRAGISAMSPAGEEICGSAADPTGPAVDRAWFELLERVSGLEALRDRRPSYEILDEEGEEIDHWTSSDVFPESEEPERWRYARSNGVALHVDFLTACRRSLWELAERDRVVRSWHGEISPARIDVVPAPLEKAGSYEWRTYSFPELGPARFSKDVEVVGVFGLPKRDDVPFVLGLAGRSDVQGAIAAAAAEALQLLAFLWGEPLPDATTSLSPTPMLHLDAFQVRGAHETVRRWLDGGHAAYGAYGAYGRRPPARTRTGVGFIDLTPSWLPNGLRVVKAISREATPLVFGESPFAAHLPRELRLHPIP